MNNAVESFAKAMLDHGINPPSHIIGDGKLHRAHAEGDKAGTLNLAYVLHLDGKPAGWFQHFRTGITGRWTLSGKREPMPAAMLQQINEARQLRQDELADQNTKAAEKARRIRHKATPISETSQHHYLVLKRVKPHGARLYLDCLAIPLYDETGAIVNLQFITPDGKKRFLKGGKKKACYFIIGEPTETILVCEGFATGASLHENTAKAVIVAFDAGNLKSVAEVMRAKYPRAEIIIAGDNDESGTGQRAANEAALAIGGKVLIPPVEGMDWNDYTNMGGRGMIDLNEAETPPDGDKLEIQPLRRAIRTAEPYPVEALGEILSGAVSAVNVAIQAPDALCSQSFLAGAALAVQGAANLRLHGEIKPLSEYFITIAGSGERKSATDGQALRPHRAWQKEAVKLHDDEIKDYAIKKAAYDKEKAQILNVKKNEQINIGALNKLVEPIPPRLPILTTEEPTFEGLFKQLQFGLPSIGVFSDEGGRLVGGHAMNADNRLKTMAGLSKLWDGVPLDRVRGGDGSSILYHRRCSMHLMIQPLAADGFINDDTAIDQGILSRMLMVKPESTKGTRLFKDVGYQNSIEVARYNKQITALINSWRWDKETGELNLEPIDLSKDAFKLWTEYHDHIERQQGESGAYHPISGFASKAAEHAARLAGIIQLFNDPYGKEITPDYIEKAIVLTDFYLGETLRIKESTESMEIAEAEKLLSWLKAERLKFIYPVKVYRLAPNSIRTKDKALPVLKLLENHGYLEQIPPDRAIEIDGKIRKQAWRIMAYSIDEVL